MLLPVPTALIRATRSLGTVTWEKKYDMLIFMHDNYYRHNLSDVSEIVIQAS